MKLIDRNELENRLSAKLDSVVLIPELSSDPKTLIMDIIEDMPYLDCIKTSHNELIGNWHND